MAPVNKKSKESNLYRQVKDVLIKRRSSSDSSSSESENENVRFKKTKKAARAIKLEKADDAAHLTKKKKQNVFENLTNKVDMLLTSKFAQKQNELATLINKANKPSSSASTKKQHEPEIPSNKDKKSKKQMEELSSSDDEFDLESTLQTNNESSQLFGENFEENMVNIGNNIFCRSIIFDSALGSSRSASHIARKLMEGVFTKDTLLKSTYTGLPARAQGKERQEVKVVALDFRARNAIINFAQNYASYKGCKKQKEEVIARSMSQHIGEIKREEEEKKKHLREL